jgi:hypothetical protein
VNRSFTGLVASVLCVALAAGLWFGACERRSERVEVGYQGEARSNRYLALQRLLEAGGDEVRSLDSLRALDSLPASDATLVIAVDRSWTLGAERSRDLLAWARSGGHLIVVSWSLWDYPDRPADAILDPLGVRQFQRDEEDQQVAVTASIGFSDRAAPLGAEFDPAFHLTLEDPERARLEASDANGTHLVTLALGSGWVTALTDDYFLSSATIDDHDHAELAYRITHLFGRDGPIWIVWNDAMPRWWALAWRHGWMLVVSLIAVAAAWVWSRSSRFGPLEADPPPSRRRLLEHIEAAGHIQLRHGARRDLLHAVRRAVWERMRRRHPGWLDLDPQPLAQRLASLAGIPVERVERALAFGSERQPEAGFARQIATLEKIRRCL